MALFISLQQAGVQGEKAIEMAFEDAQEITASLRAGKSLCQALASRPGWSLLAGLGTRMPLEQACTLILSMGKGKSLVKGQSVAAMAYPVFILGAVWFLLGFFCESVMPSMAEFLQGDALPVVMGLFRGILGIFLLLGIAWAAIIWLGLSGRLMVPVSFVRKNHTLSLLALVRSCLEVRMSSMDMVDLLAGLDLNAVLHGMVLSLRGDLLAGHDIYEALCHCPGLDRSCLDYARLGLEGLGLSKMLKMYEKKTTAQMQRQLKSLSMKLQTASYLAVGFCAVLVYQVLLAPMNILSSM